MKFGKPGAMGSSLSYKGLVPELMILAFPSSPSSYPRGSHLTF